MIQGISLYKRYGNTTALDGLDLRVEPGAIYGFLGPNGAGKTTTIRILSGLSRADKGQAFLNKKMVKMHDPHILKLVGVLPEEPVFYHWMTAREYLRDFVARLFELDYPSAKTRTDEILNMVGLTASADRRIGGFSRGMRQRLGIAQAILPRPEILLLDEPVSALDPAGRKEILELINTLGGHTTILFSTHILTDVDRICDVIGIIDQGKMLVEDRRENLLSRYAHPIIEVELAQGTEEWLISVNQIPEIEQVVQVNNTTRLVVRDIDQVINQLMAILVEGNSRLLRIQVTTPTLEEIFLRLTGKNNP
jgi:ABC-2 type transport system ATP-binding protein